MKKASLSKLVGSLLVGKDSPLIVWRPIDRPYPRILDFDPTAAGLVGQEGVYAIWHLGVRPQWLRVGATPNLGAALGTLARAEWINAFHGNAGIFMAWAMPEQNQCAGMARFLAEKLKPTFQGELVSGDRTLGPEVPPIVCPLPPGTRSRSHS